MRVFLIAGRLTSGPRNLPALGRRGGPDPADRLPRRRTACPPMRATSRPDTSQGGGDQGLSTNPALNVTVQFPAFRKFVSRPEISRIFVVAVGEGGLMIRFV